MARGKTPDMGVGLGERFDFTATFRYVFGRVFFLQSLPGNRGSYLFIDYFVILGGSPRIP